mmetsp:Transcript_73895/g.203425  ORF Transcript_73895/g.203425 Transcript_73895/m.203425 type:complete len:207 (+) Transcript_73895:2751-3371(+)|eukprot:4458759-Prymnesium_polylepis.1
MVHDARHAYRARAACAARAAHVLRGARAVAAAGARVERGGGAGQGGKRVERGAARRGAHAAGAGGRAGERARRWLEGALHRADGPAAHVDRDELHAQARCGGVAHAAAPGPCRAADGAAARRDPQPRARGDGSRPFDAPSQLLDDQSGRRAAQRRGAPAAALLLQLAAQPRAAAAAARDADEVVVGVHAALRGGRDLLDEGAHGRL